MHGCSREECWLAQNEQYGHVRVAESVTNTNTTLSINVWGSSPSNFFSILCDSVETLLREPFYERLLPQVRRKVPCPHCLLVDEKDALLFDVTALEGRLQKGKTKIECSTCAEEFDIRQLLNVAPPEAGFVQASCVLLCCLRCCVMLALTDVHCALGAIAIFEQRSS
jgi:hypothetical protein